MQTIQAVRNIRRKYKPIAQCAGDKKEQEQFRSIGTTADGFLRQPFFRCLNKAKICLTRNKHKRDFLIRLIF
jgi:hypothetical protein